MPPRENYGDSGVSTVKGPEGQGIESINWIEGSVKEKYKSIPQFNEIIQKVKSSKDLDSKSGRLIYYKILKNLDKLNPQQFNGNVFTIISQIIMIVEGDRSKGNPTIYDKIKKNLTKFKDNLINSVSNKRTPETKKLKEQLADDLYHKLEIFSKTYDRSLIDEYFEPSDISNLEKKFKIVKSKGQINLNGLRTFAGLWNPNVSKPNDERLDKLFLVSEKNSTLREAKDNQEKKIDKIENNPIIIAADVATSVAASVEASLPVSLSGSTTLNGLVSGARSLIYGDISQQSGSYGSINPQQDEQIIRDSSQQSGSHGSINPQQDEQIIRDSSQQSGSHGSINPQQDEQIIRNSSQQNKNEGERISNNEVDIGHREYIGRRDYLLYWETFDNEKSCEGTSLKRAFINTHIDWINGLKGNSIDKKINKEYLNWYNNRLKNIKKLLNKNDIEQYANRKQIIQVEGLDWGEREDVLYNIPSTNESFKNNNVNSVKESLNKFSCYTSGEILGELLINIDKIPDGFKLLQRFASSTAHGQRLFDEGHITGKWNDETQFLLQNALLDPIFLKADANANGNYSKKINEILKKHEPLKDVSYLGKGFQSLSEVQKRETEYWKDPEGYWKSQTLEGPREFVGIRDNTFGGLWDSYKEGEKDFIQNNMKGFNKKIEGFLTLPKLQDGKTPDTETKAKMDQIWNAIPIEQLDSIYEKFASNPEEQKKFKEFLKNNNIPDTDLQDASLRSFVIRKNLSLNPAAEYCYQRLWTCLQEQITGEAGKTLQYLSDKTGDTAFNIKNKVLEFFLPGISIHPENSEDGIFYFRDENNLDTLYGFNPEDGKIFQKGNISLGEDGIIKFGANEAEGNLLKQIHGFQDMISFELGDILPDKNARNVDELEKQITRKIESKINVENVVDTSVVSQALLKKENEKNVCRDRIVGDIKYLLDIQRSELHSGDGEKYKIFRSLLKTFEKIKIENPNDNTPLVTMKDFFDKVYSSANQGSLLKPYNNGESTEERDDNVPQEGENLSVENHPQEMWKTILLKNLIDPQTQFFDISLITTLNQDKEINDSLAKRDFNNVIGKIAKRKDLQELDKDTDNQISQLTEKTGEELRGLYEETQLLASIDALEKQGDFLS